MKQCLINQLNNKILRQAKGLKYIVKDVAPSDEHALFDSPSLVIWNGASDKTIFQDAQVNYAFRALHDQLHLETRLGFSPKHEVELGRIQASKYEGIIAEIVYSEVALQAEFYLKYGRFIENQVEFTVNYLKTKGFIK